MSIQRKSIMKSQNKIEKSICQFLLYVIVGAGATIVEWLFFYALNQLMKINYFLATTISFIFSTFANWLLGKLILFHKSYEDWKELAKIYLTSIIGLIMNLFIMWIAVEYFNIDKMISKIIATGIVFIWNFIIRKFIIYKI